MPQREYNLENIGTALWLENREKSRRGGSRPWRKDVLARKTGKVVTDSSCELREGEKVTMYLSSGSC